MIYFVSNQQKLFESSEYTLISVEQSLEMLKNKRFLGLDTETTGFNPHLKKLLLLQLGTKEFQVVIDCTTVDIQKYKEFLEGDTVFIGHNIKFDLKFLYINNIIPKYVYDTYITERVITLGIPRGVISLSLQSLLSKYFDIWLEKTERNKFSSGNITTSSIIYAATDVKYLIDLKDSQTVILEKEKLLNAADFENEFVKALAYIEFCGIKLDVEKWKEKMNKDLDLLLISKQNLNDWVVKNIPQPNKFVKQDFQGDLFLGFDTTPKCIINWNSPKQTLELFKYLGFDLRDKDGRESVDIKILIKQKALSTICDPYISYSKNQKLVSTYGQNFLDSINPITRRIYTNFNQCGTDTNRLSSGGGTDSETVPGVKLPLINFQNLPANSETRSCFVAEEGNKFISCDYHAQESVIMADISGDKAMIELFTTGCGDLHSLTAKFAYKDIIGDTPVEEIKTKFKDLRQKAKAIEFAIGYAGDAETIARNNNIPIDEAKEIYNNYMEGFPSVKPYQDRQRKFVLEKGYILLNPLTGHKSYIYQFDMLKSLQESFTPDFWEAYRQIPRNSDGKKSPTNYLEREMVTNVSRYFKMRSEIGRMAVNYPIQGTGAMCVKLASIKLFNWIVDNNLFGKIKYVAQVHDEICLECPESISEEVSRKLIQVMEDAGDAFCKKVKLTADVSVGDFWIH